MGFPAGSGPAPDCSTALILPPWSFGRAQGGSEGPGTEAGSALSLLLPHRPGCVHRAVLLRTRCVTPSAPLGVPSARRLLPRTPKESLYTAAAIGPGLQPIEAPCPANPPRCPPPAGPARCPRHGPASAAPRTRPWRSWRRPRSSPSSSTCRWYPRSAPSSTTTWASTTRTWVSGAGAALGRLRGAPGHGGRWASRCRPEAAGGEGRGSPFRGAGCFLWRRFSNFDFKTRYFSSKKKQKPKPEKKTQKTCEPKGTLQSGLPGKELRRSSRGPAAITGAWVVPAPLEHLLSPRARLILLFAYLFKFTFYFLFTLLLFPRSRVCDKPCREKYHVWHI